MPESVLTLLKFCLVAVLYLFFLRVVQAVWAELRQSETAPPPVPAARAPVAAVPSPARPSAPVPAPPPARPGRLRVLRPPALAGASVQLAADEMTVGRAPACAMRLDDPTVSGRHARLFTQGGSVLVDDLGSRNGTLLNGRRIQGPTRLSAGDRLGIGPNVEIEVLP